MGRDAAESKSHFGKCVTTIAGQSPIVSYVICNFDVNICLLIVLCPFVCLFVCLFVCCIEFLLVLLLLICLLSCVRA